MDEGDRPTSDDGSNDRTDPDGEGIDPDGEGIDSDGEGIDPDDNGTDDDETAPDRSTGSESTDFGTTGAPGEIGESEEKVPDRYSLSGDDSNATGSETGKTGAEERDVSTTERGHPPESHYPDDRDSLSDDRTRPPSDGNAENRESLRHRFRHDNDGALMWIREMLSSVAIVLVLGLILFALSGVWPPMVAVESPSMEPNMNTGDLVFVTEPGRFAPDAASNDIGVVTHEEGVATDYRTFGSYGSVVIFQPPGRTASPIIHRAMFHVEEGENWYERADSQYYSAGNCDELRNCPAPHSGFITLGDNNGRYDQASGLAEPVRAEWVTGVARVRVPYLGYVRLIATGQAEPGDVLATTGGFQLGGGDAMVSGGTSDHISNGPTGYDPGGMSNYEAVS